MRSIIAGTGPSLTPAVVARAIATGLPIFGCNNTYQAFDLAGHLACNPEWWDYYWPRDVRLRDMQCPKWTWHRGTAEKYAGMRYIEGRWGDGLSTDPEYIHYGHSSGYQLLGIAYHAGVRDAVLIGYDMRYPAGYDGLRQVAGGDRHYFGEYPRVLQHWTKYNIGRQGELNGLIDCYRTIAEQGIDMRIVLGTPGSALAGLFAEELI